MDAKSQKEKTKLLYSDEEYKKGVELMSNGGYAEAKQHFNNVYFASNYPELSKYKAYISAWEMIETINTLNSGEKFFYSYKIFEIVNDLIEDGNFMNASSLIDTNPLISKIKSLNGTWRTGDGKKFLRIEEGNYTEGFGEHGIEICDGEIRTILAVIEYTEGSDTLKYQDHIYYRNK